MAPREGPVQSAVQMPNVPTEVATPTPTSPEPVVERPAQSPPTPTPFIRAIDTLVSSEASFQEKQAALGQLQASGRLDQAMEALAQGAAEHPTSAAYPAALGQAQLRKAGEVASNGGKVSEMGLLGMNADQNFDAALELDPANWDAQFFKATAMSYWPLELEKGDEVIQRFSGLIDQQDTMVSQPEFAQTYVMLGDQYLKMNQPDYALATWQLGAQKFPGNPVFWQKLRGE
jgi:tetratricopeptide (TPR) repeat protein